MTSSVDVIPRVEPERPVAPLWHTALVLLLLFGLAFSSVHFRGLPGSAGYSRITRYLITAATEWMLVGVVVFGIRLRGITLRQLIGGEWSRTRFFFRDLGISICFLFGSIFVLAVLTHALHLGPAANVRNFLPHTAAERSLWILLSLTAGICEETITRGYLQRQMTALLKSPHAGIVVQGVIFGAGHAYQGWGHVLLIAVLGCMLGWLAHWRRNLRPGILAHFLQDAVGGFVG